MNDIERAIKYFAEKKHCLRNCEPLDVFYSIAAEAVQEKAEQENPKPLTLEQLKERHKNPVWLDIICEDTKLWIICGKECKPGLFYFGNYGEFPMSTYGIDWVCYDHEPKETIYE